MPPDSLLDLFWSFGSRSMIALVTLLPCKIDFLYYDSLFNDILYMHAGIL
jgi:hypothetical protein